MLLKSFAMKRVIVVGNGMVGYKFCEKLRNRLAEAEIIAYGEEPRPAYDRVHLSDFFSGSTSEDLNQIMEYARKVKRGAVMGGGLLGLEAAKALFDLGLETHVVEFASRLMPRQLDDAGSQMLAHKLSQLGITIHTGKNTKKIDGNGKLEGLTFVDGSHLAIEMLVISAGIRPRDELAKASLLDAHPRGGIQVDNYLKTNDENIFAIGEAVVHNNIVYGLVAPGYEMADIVAAQIAGASSKQFTGFDMSTKLKMIGVDVGSFGDPFGETPGSIPITFQDKHNGVYKRINISSDGKYLLGGILIGDASQYNILHQMVINKMTLPAQPESLIIGSPGKSGAEGAGVKDLPETAPI